VPRASPAGVLERLSAANLTAVAPSDADHGRSALPEGDVRSDEQERLPLSSHVLDAAATFVIVSRTHRPQKHRSVSLLKISGDSPTVPSISFVGVIRAPVAVG
jgi:hypothetical protein